MSRDIFNFRVTDHVLLRYMERMLGVDVEGFRTKLQATLEPAAKAGVRSLTTGGMVFKFSYGTHDAVVSTMWPVDQPAPKQVPPRASKLSREAMNIAARKRMKR